MKSFALFYLAFILLQGSTSPPNFQIHSLSKFQFISPAPTTDVYICKGGSAYAYHKTDNCRWLHNCTHEIVQVTVEEAVDKYGRKPCKACYPE